MRAGESHDVEGWGGFRSEEVASRSTVETPIIRTAAPGAAIDAPRRRHKAHKKAENVTFAWREVLVFVSASPDTRFVQKTGRTKVVVTTVSTPS